MIADEAKRVAAQVAEATSLYAQAAHLYRGEDGWVVAVYLDDDDETTPLLVRRPHEQGEFDVTSRLNFRSIDHFAPDEQDLFGYLRRAYLRRRRRDVL